MYFICSHLSGHSKSLSNELKQEIPLKQTIQKNKSCTRVILYAEHQIVERDCLRVILGMSAIDVPMQDAKEDKLTRGTMRSL